MYIHVCLSIKTYYLVIIEKLFQEGRPFESKILANWLIDRFKTISQFSVYKWNSWNNHFWLKNDGEKWSRFFIILKLILPSAKQIWYLWKGLVQFKHKKSRPLFTISVKEKMVISRDLVGLLSLLLLHTENILFIY